MSSQWWPLSLWPHPTCPFPLLCCCPSTSWGDSSKVRAVLQDASKVLNLRKQELCRFCTETERMSHWWSLGSKAALPVLECLTRSFLLSLRNLMNLHSPVLCTISSYRENENQFTGGDKGILASPFLLFFLFPLPWHVFCQWQNKNSLSL